MYFSENERLGLLVDGSNTHAAARSLNFDIDYKRLQEWARTKARLVASEYYTAIVPTDSAEDGYVSVKPLVDWLTYNGWRMKTVDAKVSINEVTGRRHVRSSINMEICVGIMRMSRHVDHILLCSGNGDFRPAIADAQSQGVRVTALSTLQAGYSGPMVSDDLRRQVDQFIDLTELEKQIGRPIEARRSHIERAAARAAE